MGATEVLSQQQAYSPKRFDAFIAKDVVALEAKRKMLEQKLQSTKEHQAQALKKITKSLSPKQASRYKTISGANQAVIDNLEARHNVVISLLKKAQEEKSQLRQTIKNEHDEDLAMRRVRLQLSITDLEQQVDESHRVENFLASQRTQKSEAELKTLSTLMHNWAHKRTQLETKLHNEQAALQNLK
jgi:hypothetical protein